MKTIILNLRDNETKQVKAYTYFDGIIAVHKTPDCTGYTVTHTPTGYCILAGFKYLKEAKTACAILQHNINKSVWPSLNEPDHNKAAKTKTLKLIYEALKAAKWNNTDDFNSILAKNFLTDHVSITHITK